MKPSAVHSAREDPNGSTPDPLVRLATHSKQAPVVSTLKLKHVTVEPALTGNSFFAQHMEPVLTVMVDNDVVFYLRRLDTWLRVAYTSLKFAVCRTSPWRKICSHFLDLTSNLLFEFDSI